MPASAEIRPVTTSARSSWWRTRTIATRSGAALRCTVVCAAVAVVTVSPAGRRVRADDRNADGRPDVWRQYDTQGRLTEVAVDSNYDGRSDIQEYYDRGELVRRESDRNFDDRVDLIEEFDRTTHQQIRSVVDVDYDGTADLLVLFRDGQPVYVKHVDGTARSSRVSVEGSGGVSVPGVPAVPAVPGVPGRLEWPDEFDRLVPLDDPFRQDRAVSAPRACLESSEDVIGLSPSGGLPVGSSETVGPLADSTALVAGDIHRDLLPSLLPRSPRGPPLA